MWSHNRLRGRLRRSQRLENSGQTSTDNISSNIAPETPIIPIHELPTPAIPQPNSPFYNGRIPPEIRDEIFKYALTETPSNALYGPSISRPGYTSHRYIPTALLQTCRLIYLETYKLPALNKEHIFWHAPDRGPFSNRFFSICDHEQWYFSLMTPWQLSLVKEIHLFTQMFWLEDSFVGVCKLPYMQKLEKLKITIRRGDWWWNESNKLLFIHPKRKIYVAGEMVKSIQADRAAIRYGGDLEPFNDHTWGSVFKFLPLLKELEIEFETSEDKLAELETIVDWAKSWRFPMNEGMVLSAEGEVVKKWHWEGNVTHWSEQCPYCTAGDTNGFCSAPRANEDEMKPECAERRRKFENGEGPRLHVMSLKWKTAKERDNEER